jgi:Uma2 family endonuclease
MPDMVPPQAMPGGMQSPVPPTIPPEWELDPEVVPNLDELVVEDGKPVESIFAERLYALLTETLYASWKAAERRPFMVLGNVGWFFKDKHPPLAPDVMLILDVTPEPPTTREGRSYFQWIYGKSPDLVIECVSDRRSDEEGYKMQQYARQGLPFYVIFDPADLLGHGVLRAHALQRGAYVPTDHRWIPEIGLGLTLWQGTYRDLEATWLRWCDQQGRVIPTGAERAERLAAQLRALGIEPEV